MVSFTFRHALFSLTMNPKTHCPQTPSHIYCRQHKIIRKTVGVHHQSTDERTEGKFQTLLMVKNFCIMTNSLIAVIQIPFNVFLQHKLMGFFMRKHLIVHYFPKLLKFYEPARKLIKEEFEMCVQENNLQSFFCQQAHSSRSSQSAHLLYNVMLVISFHSLCCHRCVFPAK